jgi:hypothetical protein
VVQNFQREIEYLLEQVPEELWKKHVRALMYEFLPWHKSSYVSIMLQGEDDRDPAAWVHYDCAGSDCQRIQTEVKQYDGRLSYHNLLIEAAEALLNIDFTKYGQPETIDEFCLYKPFQLRVMDPDGTFGFNYCEYVLAKRLDSAERNTTRGPT